MGNKRTGTHKSKIMLTFWVTYIMSFSIPIILNSLIYNIQLQSTIEDYQHNNLGIIKQCRDYMDSRIDEMDSIISQLGSDPILNYLIATNSTYDSGKITYKLWLMLNKMALYKQSNNFFLDFGVYIRNKGLTIDSKSVYSYPGKECERLVSFDSSDYQDFQRLLSSSSRRSFIPVMNYRYQSGVQIETNVIVYMDYIPQESLQKEGCIYFLIPVSNIESSFEQMSSYQGSTAFIINESQQVIYQWPIWPSDDVDLPVPNTIGTTGFQDILVDNMRMQLYSAYSSKTGLTFISMVPYSTVLHRVLYIKQISWISAGFLFVLGMSISFILARRNSKPILDLINLVEPVFKRYETRDRTVGYKQLHGSIASLIANNEKMSQILEQQLPILHDSFVSKLIRNEFLNDQETQVYLSHLKITIPTGPYIAVFLYLTRRGGDLAERDLKDIQAIKYILKERIKEIGFVFYAYDNDFDKMIILCSQPGDSNSDAAWMVRIDEHIDKLRRIIIGTGFTLAAGGGIPVNHLSEVGLSVSSARLALTYYNPSHPVLWHNTVKDELFYYYPPDMEKRIESLVCAGNYDMVRALLDDLYEENFRKRQLSEYAFKQLVFCMLSSINHIVLNRANLAPKSMKEIILIITNLEELVTAQEFWEKLRTIYAIICEYFQDHQQSKRNLMIQSALDYISNNFSDGQLNIHRVSDYVGINAEYFSKLFKNETGIYFSDYLEKCRIDTAAALLDTGTKVEDVAYQVGYHSSHAFRRAFKRVYGVTPTSFRKINEG